MSSVKGVQCLVFRVDGLMVWCFEKRSYGFKLLVEVGREYVDSPLLRRLHPLDEELQKGTTGYWALSEFDAKPPFGNLPIEATHYV